MISDPKFWNCYKESRFINIPVKKEEDYIIYYMLDGEIIKDIFKKKFKRFIE